MEEYISSGGWGWSWPVWFWEKKIQCTVSIWNCSKRAGQSLLPAGTFHRGIKALWKLKAEKQKASSRSVPPATFQTMFRYHVSICSKETHSNVGTRNTLLNTGCF